MQSPRVTRSSVLGKRGHHRQQESISSSTSTAKSVDQLQTPNDTPAHKRPRISTLVTDGDGNKENIPPFSPQLLTPDPSPVSARATRALQRSRTEIVSPARSRTAIRRQSSTSTLASVETAVESLQVSIATPPPSPLPPLPLHARARALLRATCNSADNEIAGRDAERATIRDFITSFVDNTTMDTDNAPTALYISGSPGCGKTALVNSVLRQLEPQAQDVMVVFINCMALNNLDSLWQRMSEELVIVKKQQSSPSKTRKLKGRDAIEALLADLRTKCVLILDELDHITPNTQSLTSLFSLPDAAPSYLRLIGIANTHTLTSTSPSPLSPSLKVLTVHFAPYTSNQLLEILQTRLRPLYNTESEPAQKDSKKFLPVPALTLLTKKIAGLTGDVRSLFEVLRGAIDNAVVPSKSTADSNSNISAVSVTPSHVLAALKAYRPSGKPKPASDSLMSATVSNSETVAKVKNLNLQARLVLLAILLASKRLEASLSLSGSSPVTSPRKSTPSPIRRTASNSHATPPATSNMDTNQLHTYYTSILTRGDSGVFDPTNRSEFGDLLNVLEVNGLVCMSSVTSSSAAAGRKTFARSTSFGGSPGKAAAGNAGMVRLVGDIWSDEVLRGLGINTSTPTQDGAEADICEEEVKAIWQRERVRLEKDIKARDMASSKGNGDVFADAFED